MSSIRNRDADSPKNVAPSNMCIQAVTLTGASKVCFTLKTTGVFQPNPNGFNLIPRDYHVTYDVIKLKIMFIIEYYAHNFLFLRNKCIDTNLTLTFTSLYHVINMCL